MIELKIKQGRGYDDIVWDDDLITQLYTETEAPLTHIAYVFCTSTDLVNRKLRDLGIDKFREQHIFGGDGKPYHIDRIICMHVDEGMTPVDISDIIQRNPNVIRELLKRHGVYRSFRRDFSKYDPWNDYGNDELLSTEFLNNPLSRVSWVKLNKLFPNIPPSRVKRRAIELDLINIRKRLKWETYPSRDEIITLYLNGNSLNHISKSIGLAYNSVRSMLINSGINIRQSGPIAYLDLHPDMLKSIAYDYIIHKLSLSKIAKKYELHENSITNIANKLRELGVHIRDDSTQIRIDNYNRRRYDSNRDDIIYDYLIFEYGVNDLAVKYHCDESIVKNILEDANITLRSSHEQTLIAHARRIKNDRLSRIVVGLYLYDLMGCNEIANQCCISQARVTRILKTLGIRMRAGGEQKRITHNKRNAAESSKRMLEGVLTRIHDNYKSISSGGKNMPLEAYDANNKMDS